MSSQERIRKYAVLFPQLALPCISSAACAVVAYSIRNFDFKYRFIAGCGATRVLGTAWEIANNAWAPILPEPPSKDHPSPLPALINTVFGMLWVSVGGYFGGKRYYRKHGIDSYKKVIIDALCPGQVYFRKNKGARKKALKNLAKIGGYSCAAYGISKILKSGLVPIEFIQSNIVLHMEALMLMLSLAVGAPNIPANLYYLIVGGNDDIEVIEPYAFVYLQPSIRDFWKGWSRPIGETLRWMVYEPLGGRNRYWLSVPALFATNCVSHYGFSERSYGNPAINQWNKAFAVMGGTMALYMLTENVFLKKKKRSSAVMDASQVNNVEKKSDVVNSIYWKIWSFGLFHASMATTVYCLMDEPMKLDLENFCNNSLMMFEGVNLNI